MNQFLTNHGSTNPTYETRNHTYFQDCNISNSCMELMEDSATAQKNLNRSPTGKSGNQTPKSRECLFQETENQTDE